MGYKVCCLPAAPLIFSSSLSLSVYAVGIVEISTLPRNKCVEIVTWLYAATVVLLLIFWQSRRRASSSPCRPRGIFYCLLSSNLNT